MKILFAIKRLENMAGGAERVILQIIDGLRAHGHDITLVTFDRKGADSFYPIPGGLNWIKLGVGDSAQRAGYVETVLRILALRKIVQQSGADVVVPFQHSMFVPMVLAMMGMRVPVIASEHIVPDHYRHRPLEYILLILAGLRCRVITVLSKNIIKMYPRILWPRMIAMPNPVAMSVVSADAVGGNRKLLLSVGRLDPQKDQKTLIEAFEKLANDYPDWDLKILGEGRLRPALEDQVRQLGLEKRIFLPGVSQNIMVEYQSAQAFVLASTYEAFGLATAEAMSAGLPVVGFSDCAGTNELIRHQHNGILVDVISGQDRSVALSRVLDAIMGDADLRQKLGRAGRAEMAQHAPQLVVAAWNDLLLSL
jgi:glycosyltransferase involved in cell wall biosynthesis